jgi:HEAT repeat protein
LLARLRTAEGTDRITLLRALGNTGDVRVLPALELALKSTSDYERAAATESLRLIPDVRADALILVTLEDKSSIVRAAAVFSASYRPLDPVLGALAIRARADEDVTIRRAIVELAATRMSELPALRPIVTYAAEHDADAELRAAAKQFLS